MARSTRNTRTLDRTSRKGCLVRAARADERNWKREVSR
jgi:hypothetical protein